MAKKTVTIRLPEELHEEIKRLAAEDHRTISSYIELIIINKLKSNNYIDPGVSEMRFCPEVLPEEKIKEIYKAK